MRGFDKGVSVITGAGSGIGRALALELSGRGARLALSDVNEAGLAETVRLAEARGAEVFSERLDVSEREAVEAHAGEVEARLGPANLIVNNAGVSLVESLSSMSYEDFEWLMSINFWGVVYGCKAFLPQLERSKPAQIINISSLFGLIGVPVQTAYCASKFAVRGFTESLRQELTLSGSHVQVACVHPGGVRTNIVRGGRFGDVRHLIGTQAEIESRFDRNVRTTPEAAAKTILAGAARGDARIIVGPDARLMDALVRVFPVRYQRVGRSIARLLKRRSRG